jgi:hypothetical protein
MTYALVICGPCAHDCHAECGGKKALLMINGDEFTGTCQCPNAAHSSLRRKGDNAKENNDGYTSA